MNEIEDLSDSDDDDDHEIKTDGHICNNTEPDEEQPKVKTAKMPEPEQQIASASVEIVSTQAIKVKPKVQKKPGRFAGKQAYNDDYDNYDSHYDNQYDDYDL